jgi:hypothetical protein
VSLGLRYGMRTLIGGGHWPRGVNIHVMYPGSDAQKDPVNNGNVVYFLVRMDNESFFLTYFRAQTCSVAKPYFRMSD